ncbi:hypothetical protein [Aliikangiella marina]|uniref:hypothetical protein n=1 Tax=Aliikangiella marina TaxID=1712262 RepID=UPI00163D9772|nr:hypothetical protein [Aliikangiella marina]
MSELGSDPNTNAEDGSPKASGNKKGAVFKALLIGFGVGVMFIVAAKLVNFAINV